LRSHLIEPATLWNDDFEAFFELRTQALLDLIGKAMGKSVELESLEGQAQSNGNGYQRVTKVNSHSSL
jgi:hypothetical protein